MRPNRQASSTAGSRPFRSRRRRRRRGAMLVLIALMMVVFVAAAAFSVDVAYMQLVRTQLRTATDSAARAGGEALARMQSIDDARLAAKDMAAANFVAGAPLLLYDSDVEFGNSFPMPDGKWAFVSYGTPINSLRVNGRRTADSLSGSVAFFIAPALGVNDFEPTQIATVVRFDRDICLVVDRSNSMKLNVTESASGVSSDDPRYCQPPDPISSRWAALVVAVQGFLDVLDVTPQIEHVGLVSFASDFDACDIHSNASDINQALTADSTLITGAMQGISDTAFNGRTETGTGIDSGVAVLTDPDTARPFARKAIVLLTDGHTTSGRSPVYAAQDAVQQYIVVHTITFGNDADQVQMQEVAGAGNGKHYHAPDAEALEMVFREIALSMLVILTE
jgi:Ca-activated chloride channel homolog